MQDCCFQLQRTNDDMTLAESDTTPCLYAAVQAARHTQSGEDPWVGGGTPGTTQYSLDSPVCNYQHLDLHRLKLALTHWNRPSTPPQPVVILNDRVEADWVEPETDTDVAGLFARHLGTYGAPTPEHA